MWQASAALCPNTTSSVTGFRYAPLEEIPEVRPQVVPRIALVVEAFGQGFLSRRGIVLFVPLFHIRFAQVVRKTEGIIMGAESSPSAGSE